MSTREFIHEEFGRVIHTNRKLAAVRQIEAAIDHYRAGQFECAITLSAAAEGLLPETDNNHIFKLLKENSRKDSIDYNLLINWLKHPTSSDEILLPEFEVAVIVMRGISKLIALYNEGTENMRRFAIEVFEKGHLPVPPTFS